MRKSQQAIGCHQIGISLVPAIGRVDPTAVGLLKFGQFFSQLLFSEVFRAVGRRKRLTFEG